MMLSLGCIADDYTGASDLANTLTRCGLRTVQTIGIPDASLRLRDADAVVVSLKSRSIAAEKAVSQSLAANNWLRDRGAAHVLFKICSTFDSTDAGNIGPVMDALREASGDPIVLVTPAFPETSRTVYQGHLFVGSVPLNESPLKDHPLNPMHDANLVRVLGRQSRHRVGLADRAAVAAGEAALREKFAGLARDGISAAITDAVEPDDLDVIGRVALDRRLSAGASGLGFGLARAVIALRRVTPQKQASEENAVGGYAACLAGSCSQATLQQIARAESVMPVLRLDPERLIGSRDETQSAIGWASARLSHSPILIASSASPEAVRALQTKHGGDAAGQAIEQAMADIAEALIARGVRRLVVAGGETSGAVVDRLRLPGFMVGDEIAPGVPVLRTLADPSDRAPMLLVLKSGNFGGPEFFSDALARLR